jgi:hemerythrin
MKKKMAKWKEEYSVGVELFDRQHKHLFKVINELAEQSGEPPNLHIVTQILKDMFNYAQEHFTDEEKLMEQCGYPEINEQKRQHAYFLKTIAELCAYPPEDKEVSIAEIAEFLNIWWTIHVLRWDMKYKKFFKKKLAPAGR